MKGVGVWKNVAGRTYFSSWPAPRGPAKSPAQQRAQDDFAGAVVIIKNMVGDAIDLAQLVSEGTPLMPRDFLMAQLFQRAFYFVLADGRKVFPMVARQDVSLLIDTLAQLQGDMLVRRNTFWEPLSPGDEAQVLTIAPDGTPAWMDPAAGTAPAEAILIQPQFDPLNWVNSLGSPAFGASLYIPTSAVVLHGLRFWVGGISGSITVSAAIYQKAPPDPYLPGSTLLVQGVAQAAVVGWNNLPLPHPTTLTPGAAVWAGVNLLGTGHVDMATAPFTTPVQYFGGPYTTLPSTAPAGGNGYSNLPWWWY